MTDLSLRTLHSTDPGVYLIETASGSTYRLLMREDRTASMLRLPNGAGVGWYLSRPLHGDREEIELTMFWLMEGRPAVFSYDDERARDAPDYEREPGGYPGTRRTTTPVTTIACVTIPDTAAEL